MSTNLLSVFFLIFFSPYSLDDLEVYEKHCTVMNYRQGAELKQVNGFQIEYGRCMYSGCLQFDLLCIHATYLCNSCMKNPWELVRVSQHLSMALTGETGKETQFLYRTVYFCAEYNVFFEDMYRILCILFLVLELVPFKKIKLQLFLRIYHLFLYLLEMRTLRATWNQSTS